MIGCVAMAAAPDRRVVQAKLVRAADTETVDQPTLHGRLKVATVPAASQAVTRRPDTETIAMMGLVLQAARGRRMAARVATEPAAGTKAHATERHAVAVLAARVASVAAVGEQQAAGALVPTHEADVEANTHRHGRKRRQNGARLK